MFIKHTKSLKREMFSTLLHLCVSVCVCVCVCVIWMYIQIHMHPCRHVEGRGEYPMSFSNPPYFIHLRMGLSLNLGFTSCCCCFNVCLYFPCMHACACSAKREQIRISNLLELELWRSVGDVTSRRAANTLNYWPISPDFCHNFLLSWCPGNYSEPLISSPIFHQLKAQGIGY